ncbi:hypothetical protein DENSPDRAFT_886099 [Dentipellis sp. KUC8613]|nr:hypothetical protein DENSPDRAFT_886099 [Dentipellis sp. KUC8613]
MPALHYLHRLHALPSCAPSDAPAALTHPVPPCVPHMPSCAPPMVCAVDRAACTALMHPMHPCMPPSCTLSAPLDALNTLATPVLPSMPQPLHHSCMPHAPHTPCAPLARPACHLRRPRAPQLSSSLSPTSIFCS